MSWSVLIQLYDFHARQYDEKLGRFLTIDPLAAIDYSVSPYVYCNNDPVNFTDPLGLTRWWPEFETYGPDEEVVVTNDTGGGSNTSYYDYDGIWVDFYGSPTFGGYSSAYYQEKQRREMEELMKKQGIVEGDKSGDDPFKQEYGQQIYGIWNEQVFRMNMAKNYGSSIDWGGPWEIELPLRMSKWLRGLTRGATEQANMNLEQSKYLATKYYIIDDNVYGPGWVIFITKNTINKDTLYQKDIIKERVLLLEYGISTLVMGYYNGEEKWKEG